MANIAVLPVLLQSEFSPITEKIARHGSQHTAKKDKEANTETKKYRKRENEFKSRKDKVG